MLSLWYATIAATTEVKKKKRLFKDQKTLDELTLWYKLKKQTKQRQYMITGGLRICDSDGLKSEYISIDSKYSF